MEQVASITKDDIKDLVRRIAAERIGPTAGERDKTGAFPYESIKALGESGVLGMIVSEQHGGANVSRSDFALAIQEIAKACASTALVVVSHCVVAKAIEIAGTEASKDKWLPRMMDGRALGAFAVHEADSGSNAAAIRTTVKKDGDHYIINGSKFFITSAGEADIYMVMAKTYPQKDLKGMSAFLVDKETPGLSFGCPEDKMGLRCSSSREMGFSDCAVPRENLLGIEDGGVSVFGKSLAGWGFFGAAGISVGIAQAAVDLAVRHAKDRKIAGQPIGIHQAVQSLIAKMIVETEASEATLATCAAKADAASEKAGINGFKAKLHASEIALGVANRAIQVMGGHGYCRDYTVERLFRDAKGLTLHFKTAELLCQDIAKAALGL
ncbi:acyl-CoA dehydrogenase family protein [candidate division WOR-3 bacterium]|nr:acyl-CoA dehydrogenase family protein [candidate division WOR-3 bacterium]